MSRSEDSECRVYVGNLPPDVQEKEVEDLFYKYGRIASITLKNRNGPPFAFVEYEDPRDAGDAVKGRSGYNFDGYRLRVEHPRGNRDRGDRGGGYDRYDRRDDRGGFRDRGGPGMGRPAYNSYSFRHGVAPARRTEHRVVITGIPATGSWQDLKDHMREAGDVCYADVNRDGSGVVEFMNRDDMKFAIRHLDDTKFRSHEGESSYIRVRADDDDVSPGRSRSRSNDRRSPSYSPNRKSKSPRARRSYSRSPLRSRSR